VNLVDMDQLQIIYMLSPIICAGLCVGYYFGIRGTDEDIEQMKESIKALSKSL